MALVTSCAGADLITETELCREIPFADGAEGACASTVSHKSRLVPKEQWAQERPFMLMLTAKSWIKIKLKWLEACRNAVMNGDQCNTQVQTVDTIIRTLDDLARKLVPLPK